MHEKTFAVAAYFIANADQDEGITNLKLQKLCSYAQAFALVLLDKPLFPDQLAAWPHGPVVPVIYDTYRTYGKNQISTDVLPSESRIPFTHEELYILETVNGYYGRFAAWTLRDMSHCDFPGDFTDAKRPIIKNSEIKMRFAENKVIRNILDSFQ